MARPHSGLPGISQPTSRVCGHALQVTSALLRFPSSVRSRGTDRAAVGVLLGLTAGAYLWNLTVSGWGNAFYAAAAQAGSQSWTAFVYGASDAAGSITVDKPPLSLWVMAASVRLFGLSPTAVLAPQVLLGVLAVATLVATVRRRTSLGPALLAGAVLASTPVAALMFRYDNPDALLTLLLVLAAAAVLRAVEAGRTRWMLVAGALVGAAFLTKQLQAFLVLPAFALAYLVAAPVSPGRRLRDAFLALGAMVVAGGWWVALVEVVPATDRPYIGGSQTNSFLELTFGYNGFGRLDGRESGAVGGAHGWGETGLGRLFAPAFAGQFSWLAPAALIGAVAILWWTRRRPRTDPLRADVLLWSAWLGVSWLTFSLMAGIFHAYYTVVLAPAIAALVGIAGGALWRARGSRAVRLTLAAGVVATAGWSALLLHRSPLWLPWLGPLVVVAALAAALALALGGHVRVRGLPLATTGAALGIAAVLAGPLSATATTLAQVHTGAVPTAGPLATSGPFPSGPPGGALLGLPPTSVAAPLGGPSGILGRGGRTLALTRGSAAGAPGASPGVVGRQGALGLGGLLRVSEPSAAILGLISADAADYRWVAAAVGSNTAAGYQLASGSPVMPVGGFNGSDPSPTLAAFQAEVAAHRIHWFIGSSAFAGQRGGATTSRQIATWVETTFPPRSIDGVRLYDLSGGVPAGG